jgi:acyl-CoA synthetase (AMP-forming)/AMP-acid ligase II
MTETCGPHTACPPDQVGVIVPEELEGSFGFPMPHVHHKIVDPESGATLPEGEFGELCVRGYSVTESLYKRERREVFDDDGWYLTGDEAMFKQGCLIFNGRLGEMIKTAGANVSPREVEVALEELPEIELAQVVGLPDEQRGELVAAVLVPASDEGLDVDAVVTWLRERIATYKVPRRFAVTTRDQLPFLASTKVDRRELARRLATGDLASTTPA